jgi:hypothetical protein
VDPPVTTTVRFEVWPNWIVAGMAAKLEMDGGVFESTFRVAVEEDVFPEESVTDTLRL